MGRDLDAAVASNLLKGIRRISSDEFDVRMDFDSALDDAFQERGYLRPEDQYAPRTPKPAWRVAMEAIGAAHTTKVSQEYSALLKRCQSPVEELFFLAFAIRVASMYETELRMPSGFYPTQACCGRPRLQERSFHICPQHQSGQIHVDFLVTYTSFPPPHEEKEAAHIEWPTSHVMVECDGHEFHEKTKEQARRDKKRDRELQKLGFPVLRYTGSEVWADPIACAGEVMDYLKKQLGELV